MKKIFSASFQLQHFPDNYKIGRIIFLKKPGGDPSSSKSYRPITLLPVLGKMLEKIASNRLWFIAEKQNWISKQQFGFRKKRGTELALFNFVNQVESAFKKKQETLCIMVDVSSAFPSVWHNFIIDRLLHLKCPAVYIHWIASYLDKRKVYVETQEGKVFMHTKHGTPQGAVISSLLFLIAIDDLLQTLNQHDQQTTAFADDLAITVTGSNRKVIEQKANSILETLRIWGLKSKTTFNTIKTKAMLFSHLQRIRQINLRLGANKIELVNQFKYLGIMLDTKLSFRAHLDMITQKASEQITKIMAVAKLKWGIDPVAAKIFKMAILPMILYGSPIWGRVTKLKTHVKKLRRVQRLAAISITGALRTSSTEALLVLAGLEPIESTIAIRGANLYVKAHLRADIREDLQLAKHLAIHDSLPYHDTALQWADAEARKIGWKPDKGEQIADITQFVSPEKYFDPCVTIENKEDADKTARQLCSEINPSKLILFTDASKIGPTGASAIAIVKKSDLDHTFYEIYADKFTPNVSVYRAELQAVSEALNATSNLVQDDTKEIWIFSDSEAALQTILHYKKASSPTVIQILNQIQAIKTQRVSVKIRWCPSHCGIIGNEDADKAAKAATELENATQLPLNFNDFKRNSIQALYNEWQYYWQRESTGRFTYSLLPNVKNSTLQKLATSYGRQSKLLFRLILGHIPINSYLYRFKLRPNDACDTCSTPESIEHLLLQCRKSRDLRLNYYNANRTFPSTDAKELVLNHTDLALMILQERFK